jgi:hypothetical protein
VLDGDLPRTHSREEDLATAILYERELISETLWLGVQPEKDMRVE